MTRGEPTLPVFRRRDRDPDDEARVLEHRRRQILDHKLRKAIDDRSGDVGTASPYDLLTDALMNVVTDHVFDALHSPDFAQALAERGYAVVPYVNPDEVPVPDDAWLHDATDLIGGEGEWNDPIGRLDELWRRAWAAGRAAATPDA